MTYNIRAASVMDAAIIAPLLREEDKNEIAAMLGWDAKSAIEYSISTSDEAFIATRPDGYPILIAGVGEGIPWMLGTPLVSKYGKSLVKEGRKKVREWTDKYDYLTNYVDVRNSTHVMWLSYMGFTIEFAHHFIGADRNVPFYRFYRSN
jgi:hypothetical protein